MIRRTTQPAKLSARSSAPTTTLTTKSPAKPNARIFATRQWSPRAAAQAPDFRVPPPEALLRSTRAPVAATSGLRRAPSTGKLRTTYRPPAARAFSAAPERAAVTFEVVLIAGRKQLAQRTTTQPETSGESLRDARRRWQSLRRYRDVATQTSPPRVEDRGTTPRTPSLMYYWSSLSPSPPPVAHKRGPIKVTLTKPHISFCERRLD